MSASSRRKSRRAEREASPPSWLGARLLLVFLVAFAVSGVAVVKWARTPAGRMHLANRGVATAERWAHDHLQASVLDAIAGRGVPSDSVSIRDDGAVTTLELGTNADLLDLDIAITGAVDAAGGRVHRGVRLQEDGGATLDLLLGTERFTTHRILAHRAGASRVEPPPLPRGRLAIVIDDWGHNLGPVARRLLALDAPLTLAILPERKYSRRILTEAGRAGKQALLHLPMEPNEETDQKPGALSVRVGMAPASIAGITRRALDGLPGVEGINNHMGSKATRFRPEMEAVMDVVAERGLFFLDSLTTPESVAYAAAGARGVPRARNDLFLDVDTEDPAVVESRLASLVELARSRGHAIGIGHVNEATADALEDLVSRLAPGDVQLVFLSELVYEPPAGLRVAR